MCKIFALSNTSGLDAAALSALIARAHREITITSRQADGWGFAHGSYMERWDRPAQWPGPFALPLSMGGAVIELDALHDGTPPPAGPPLICHGRIATCARGAENAHPHRTGDWTLVHNGVVEPRRRNAPRRSCDSMHIADSLAKHGGPHGLAQDLCGYLALLGIDPQGRLFAIRDNTAPLWIAHAPALGCYALASTPELIRSIMGANHATGPAFQLAAYRWHVDTPQGWSVEEVKPWEFARTLSDKAGKAFGTAAPKARTHKKWEWDDSAEYEASKNERWPMK